MERWKRAMTLEDAKFRELFGVRKETFLQMLDVVTAAREKRRRRGGPRTKLSAGDQLFLALQYWREYRTMEHLAYDFDVSKSTVCNTIMRVEEVLIADERFHLPGKKALLREENAGRTVAVDVTESPVERPKKNKKSTTRAKKSDTR